MWTSFYKAPTFQGIASAKTFRDGLLPFSTPLRPREKGSTRQFDVAEQWSGRGYFFPWCEHYVDLSTERQAPTIPPFVVPAMPLPGYGVGRERPRPTGPAPTGKPRFAAADCRR